MQYSPFPFPVPFPLPRHACTWPLRVRVMWVATDLQAQWHCPFDATARDPNAAQKKRVARVVIAGAALALRWCEFALSWVRRETERERETGPRERLRMLAASGPRHGGRGAKRNASQPNNHRTSQPIKTNQPTNQPTRQTNQPTNQPINQ